MKKILPSNTSIRFDKDYQEALIKFREIHKYSKILKIFVPEKELGEFIEWHERTDIEDEHCSYLILALVRGYLNNILNLEPLIFKEGKNLTRQYKEDLRERWIYEEDCTKRQKKANLFSSRIAEIQTALWLSKKGWIIENLEAYNKNSCDIEASKDNLYFVFEVKSIGMEQDYFQHLINSNMFRSPLWFNPADGQNYVLYRICEAAKQLEKIELEKNKVVVIVIHGEAWATLININCKNFQFSDGSEKWRRFLLGKKNPEELKAMTEFISNLNEIKILNYNSEHILTEYLAWVAGPPH